MKTIYDLDLNEQINKNGILITRVPGGWIYMINGSQPLFIKLDYEFDYLIAEMPISPEKVIEVIRQTYGFKKDWLTNKSREGLQPQAKQIIAKILTEKINLSQSKAADYINYSNRASITSSLKSLNNDLGNNSKLREKYVSILRKLNLKP